MSKRTGKAYIVTGGASGLGEAVVRRLQSEGASILIIDINEKKGNQLVSELGEDKTLFLKCDISKEEDVKNAVDLMIRKFGGVHGVINCAGIAAAKTVVSSRGPHSLSLFKKVIDVNLVGTFNLIRLAAIKMKDQQPYNDDGERGVIINVASVAAFEGQIGQAAYSASKGGVVGMTLPIARELARFGIRVVTIAPGIFATPMGSMMPERVKQSLLSQQSFPKNRFGKPNEFADMCAFIIDNSMVNGTTLRIDAGIRMSAM